MKANPPLTQAELDSDLLHVLSNKFYLKFSNLVNQILAEAPEHLRAELEERLQEKSSVYAHCGEAGRQTTDDDSVYCPHCSTLLNAQNVAEEDCPNCSHSLKGIKDTN